MAPALVEPCKNQKLGERQSLEPQSSIQVVAQPETQTLEAQTNLKVQVLAQVSLLLESEYLTILEQRREALESATLAPHLGALP